MVVAEVHGSGEGVEEDGAIATAIQAMVRGRLRRVGGDEAIWFDDVMIYEIDISCDGKFEEHITIIREYKQYLNCRGCREALVRWMWQPRNAAQVRGRLL